MACPDTAADAAERGDRRLRVLLDKTEWAGWPIVVPVGPLARVDAQPSVIVV